MTTYTTPQFATGLPERNVRPESGTRVRPATAATYPTAGVLDDAAVEAAAYAEGPTPDWQPGGTKGMPKAAIGALGAAVVGGIALAIVLMAPSNKVTKQVSPDPIAQATASNVATEKANDATEAAVNQIDKQAPAAGTTAAAAPDATPVTAAPAPVQAVIPAAPPVVDAPVARVPKHVPAPVAAHKVAPQPMQSVPKVTPDAAPAPVATPPADVQPPAMQQTPDSTTVTPLAPASPAPTQPTPETPAPTPAPAQ